MKNLRPRQNLVLWLIVSLLFLSPGLAHGQAEPPLRLTPTATLTQGALLSDITKTLQEQIEEFTKQVELQQARLAKAQQASQSLAVAVSTHKTALTLEKITVEQAKELQQYYARSLEQRTKLQVELQQELEKFGKIQAELLEASKKTELDKAAMPEAKTLADKTLEQQRRQYQTLVKTASSKLEEVIQSIQAQIALATQEQQLLVEFSEQLATYAATKSRQQLLERQRPTDFVTLLQELLSASLTLPQRLWRGLQETVASGEAARLVRTYRSELVGLTIFLALMLYSMHLLRRASRDYRAHLAAKAQTFTSKLSMALINAFVKNYYLLALIIWLALSLAVMKVVEKAAAQILLGGLLVITLISLIRHILWAIFTPGDPDKGILRLPNPTARYYYRFGSLALIFLVAGYYLLWSLRLVGLEGAGYTFAVLSYILTTVFWLLLLLRKPHLEILLMGEEATLDRRRSKVIKAVRLLIFLGLSIILIIDLLGFQNLALYLASAVILSVSVLAGGWLLKRLGQDLIATLTDPKGFLAMTLHWQSRTLEGLHLFLTQVFNLLVILLTVIGLGLSWGIEWRGLKLVLTALSQGPSVGPFTLSPLAIVLAAASIWVARKLSRISRVVLESGIFQRQQWDVGIQHTIANTVHYAIMTVGIFVALGFLGINFSNIAIIAGGLGVGIGFGLQNIVNNFFSGLILLFERPIKVGDLLIIDGQWGTVKAIRVRSTVFETSDRSVLIIPNSEMLSSKILNWTFFGRGPNRLALKISVAYGSDVHQVTRVLDQICRQNHRVLTEPPPQVFFSAYGDSSLDFTVWVFLRSPADRVPATHELNSAIFDAFREKGLEFPYPQLDVHLRTMPSSAPSPVQAPPIILPAEPEER